ncbi:MAG: hypothetical protein WBI34_12675 [Tenuifilaceae bacterium]|jgi:hypothetical protein|nr:hypothetical protein [Bacteroidales bacterium]MDI9517561.1 hypothetical protein [Bacteroidota bacterium]NLH55632.1 hypothetical protein [Rikenellaceae bacterium]OQC64477.1 MAG: hypothetical protein BWX49_00644 [Bacteroidetes bacterium ADurb.Bin008]HNV80898.1 hypothetical protein [Tenuifilaceae bacterium]
MEFKKKAFSVLFCFSLFFPFNGFTQQSYKTGLGLRGGYPSGLTVKHFIDGSSAVEGVLSFGSWGLGFTALYQIHVPIKDAPGFNWYYGGGAHVGIAKASGGNPFSRTEDQKLFLGVDGIFGAEYVFPDIPISLSLDLSPIVSIMPELYPWFNAGLSLRYTLR